MALEIKRPVGATSNILLVFIEDESSPGTGKTGLVFNTASLVAYYKRDVGTAAVAITLATATLGTFTSGGFKEVDATNMPGWYEFCPPDAALASGAKSVAIAIKGATDMLPCSITIDLDDSLVAESYAADGVQPTKSQILHMIWAAIAEVAISGTTMTIKKLDGSTTAMTFTLNSSTAPTSRTRAT